MDDLIVLEIVSDRGRATSVCRINNEITEAQRVATLFGLGEHYAVICTTFSFVAVDNYGRQVPCEKHRRTIRRG